MTGLQIASSVLLIVISAILIILVLLQKNRSSDASAINGAASSSFFDKTQGRGKDATLEKLTVVFGVALAVVVLASIGINLFL